MKEEMKKAAIVLVVAFLCACRARTDSGSPQVPRPDTYLDVKVTDILPIRVMYESKMRQREYITVLNISEKQMQVQKWQGTQLVTGATAPLDSTALAKALESVPKDYFKGKVEYSHPNIRDGARVRMITPLGDISEYGVFSHQPDPNKWPQSILKLAPLFRLFNEWSTQLKNAEPALAE